MSDIMVDWPTIMMEDLHHYSLSVAAFLQRAGSLKLARTCNQGSGVERRVPEMSRMMEFSCTSTRLVHGLNLGGSHGISAPHL